MGVSELESAEELLESEPEIMINDTPIEIGSAPSNTESTTAELLIPISETELQITDYAFIGFEAAGIALVVSLGVAAIIRIFWRSAS